MKNNLTQVKSDGLPVVSEDQQVQKNSMRLYIYLISISKFQGKNKPRTFTQRDFTINQIHKFLNMHDTTIKRYWKILEDNDLIKYEGPANYETEQDEWNKKFMERKKNKASFYSIPKAPNGWEFRILPKETIDKIQKEFLVSEQELKLYLMLANMQEHFCYYNSEDCVFTMTDLRELLGLSKKMENNKAIAISLLWLQELKLIEYTTKIETNNLGERYTVFYLKAVNYYTDGGAAASYIDNDKKKMSNEVKNDILNKTLLIEFID